MSSVFSQLVKENHNSDQSISEEEDLKGDWAENWVSLGNPVEKKEDLQVYSKVDLLRDAQELDSAVSAYPKKQNNFCHEDEIEFPAFDNVDDSVHIPKMASPCISNEEIICFPKAASVSISDEEIISDYDEVKFPTNRSIKRYEGRGTRTNRESEALVHSRQKPGCSSSYRTFPKLNKSFKGDRGKQKSSSLFCSQSHEANTALLPNDKNETSALLVVPPIEELNFDAQKQWNKSMADLLEDYNEKVEQSENPEMPIDAVIQQGNIEHSMSDFLDCFQERSGLPQSNLKMRSKTKGRSKLLVHQRSISSLGDRNMGSNSAIEALDSEQSSGDEENPQNLKAIVPGKTMADQFQDVLGDVYGNDGPLIALPRQSGTGLFGKLQCVMQNEKEAETIFLRSLHTDDCSKGDSRRIDVRILSRSLEAKLTVCCCALVGDEERTVSERTFTIIFSLKTCSDVELEVGNLIRIHPPWKEAQVEGKDIILSTYFSQIY